MTRGQRRRSVDPVHDVTEETVITPRKALLAAGLAFAVTEATDAFFIAVPGFAVLFAALFVAATAWFWRRGTARAAVALMLLFVFELAEAPNWETPIGVKLYAGALAGAGIIAALSVLVARATPASGGPLGDQTSANRG
jgi:hypothetical protein